MLLEDMDYKIKEISDDYTALSPSFPHLLRLLFMVIRNEEEETEHPLTE